MGQTLTLGELKADESSSLPPASGTVGQWGEGFGERLGVSLGYGTSSNSCRRITQLQDLQMVSLEGINEVGTGL